jgi:hypothetical protein
VPARSKTSVCGRSLAGIAGSNPAGGLPSPTECGVSELDRGASIMGRPWPTGAVAPKKKKRKKISYFIGQYLTSNALNTSGLRTMMI